MIKLTCLYNLAHPEKKPAKMTTLVNCNLLFYFLGTYTVLKLRSRVVRIDVDKGWRFRIP